MFENAVLLIDTKAAILAIVDQNIEMSIENIECVTRAVRSPGVERRPECPGFMNRSPVNRNFLPRDITRKLY